jgi:hypothetical protein
MIPLSLREIARVLGGDVLGRDTVLAPGPGHSHKDRSLAIKLNSTAPDGFLIFSHAGDDWKTCREHVRSRLGLPSWEPGDGQDRRVPPSGIKEFDRRAVDCEAEDRLRSEDDLLRIKRAVEIWDAAADPRGTLAETYLQSRRLDLGDELAGNVLRFHARCPWQDENTGKTERVPALIAAFRSIDNDEITAIHRIALNPDGTKIGRRMFGVVRRAAVKLDPAGERLSIGEGVETCLAGCQLGFAPAWALGSVGAISFFPLIDGVQLLTIFGEAGDASAGAIKIAGTRWRRGGRRVRVVMPNAGSDLNDVISEQVS